MIPVFLYRDSRLEKREERKRLRDGICQAILRQELRLGPEAPLRIARQEQGKPYLPDHPGLHFNQSDSGEYMAVATHGSPIGIDIEKIRERAFDPLLERWFLPEERELVQEEASPEVRLAQFIRLWTCKESILKYIGCGLGAEMRLHPVLSRKDAVGKLLPHGRYQNQELVFNSMIFNVSNGVMAFDERAAHPGDLIITLCFAGNGSTPFPDIRYILYPGPSKPPTP